jgi:hypothetical protein
LLVSGLSRPGTRCGIGRLQAVRFGARASALIASAHSVSPPTCTRLRCSVSTIGRRLGASAVGIGPRCPGWPAADTGPPETETGCELLPVLLTLTDWGNRHLADGESPLTHRHGCGADFKPCPSARPVGARRPPRPDRRPQLSAPRPARWPVVGTPRVPGASGGDGSALPRRRCPGGADRYRRRPYLASTTEPTTLSAQVWRRGSHSGHR